MLDSCDEKEYYAVQMVRNSPSLRELLDSQELSSIVPDFSTIENIKQLTSTQICMALQNLLIKGSFYYQESKEVNLEDKQFLFGGREFLITPPHGVGIIDANIPIILIFLRIINSSTTYIKNIIIEKKLSTLNFTQIIEVFRNILIDHVIKWDKYLFSKNSLYLEYLEKYNLASLLLINYHKNILEHPLFVSSFFTNRGKLKTSNISCIEDSILYILFAIKYNLDIYSIMNRVWDSTDNKKRLLFSKKSLFLSINSILEINGYGDKHFDLYEYFLDIESYSNIDLPKLMYIKTILYLYENIFNDTTLTTVVIDLHDDVLKFINDTFLTPITLNDENSIDAHNYIIQLIPYMLYSYISKVLQESYSSYKLNNDEVPNTWAFELAISNNNYLCFKLPYLDEQKRDVENLLNKMKNNVNDQGHWNVSCVEALS